MFTPGQIRQIIEFLFPAPFWRCDAPAGFGCIPTNILGL